MNNAQVRAEALHSLCFAAMSLTTPHIDSGAMPSSARLCYEDGLKLAGEGRFTLAIARFSDSLSYSVGIFSPAHKAVAALRNAAGEL